MSFKICVIGCGHITHNQHAPAYRRYAEANPSVSLAACCDLDRQRAEALRAAFGFAAVYTDPFDMLAAERPDVVCLNVPVHLTAGLARRILELGYPLLTEKPPALTLAELDPLIAAAEAAAAKGVAHQVAFNRRFAPLVVILKELLHGQTILQVEHTFTRVNRPDPDFTTTAIHGIDTLRHLLGSDYARLEMRYPLVTQPGQPPAPAFILNGHFQTGAGVHMLFQPLSGLASERTVVYTPGVTYDLRLNHAVDSPGSLLVSQGNQVTRTYDAAELAGGSEDYLLSGFYGEDAAFFDALRAGRASEHTLASARQSVAVMEALRDRCDVFENL